MAQRKLLVVQAAALGCDFLSKQVGLQPMGLSFRPLESVFPAVTCTVQASFRTASLPREHGVVANGFFHRELRHVYFWEQSAGLVGAKRIWDGFRKRGHRVGTMFWQQSLGEDADLVLSPAPIHKHHGRMIPDCYGKPTGLYETLCSATRREFGLAHYWGPRASAKSGDWISAATAALLGKPRLAPELCLVYLPTLDYDLQRYGPDGDRSRRALEALLGQLKLLLNAARANDYEMLVFGDYAMGRVRSDVVFPNRALADAGLFRPRRVGRMTYPDFHESRAFAVTDHEVAHVYVRNPEDVPTARKCLSEVAGVEQVLDREAQKKLGLDHERSGELVLVARDGTWFAYPWWKNPREAPDYAGHVDIHNKPGFDPCELFFGRLPSRVSTDPSRIAGTHGRTGPDRLACWASTFPLADEPRTLVELASAVRSWLDRAG
jgi:predicted AlkP superfamily pyrophosphatase or phosphodiesterase